MNLLFIDGEAVETLNEVATETAQTTSTGSDLVFWIMIIAMIAIMYFFMWRPESKRRKQMENFRKGLKKGDKIITAGGIYGVVKEVHETSLLIEVDSNVTLRIDKNMVVGDPTQGVINQ
ncbi:MAG: preprotein translocase subunit YajC [Alistipes sp.]|nr:preprotein translocase subunit YajC [Alistipes sp.]